MQSPRVSGGTLVQSPLSSKSGEFSSGSAGPHFGTVTTATTVGASQKEKAAISSATAVGGTPSMTSGDSLQRQHQPQLVAKRRSNSLTKNSSMGAVGSPASVNNANVPLNAASPSIGPQSIDKDVLERFSKIEMVTMRYVICCFTIELGFMYIFASNVWQANSLLISFLSLHK